MLDSAIRTISIARRSPIVAAALFEKKVQIWNFANAELVSELDTVFQFGGRRLTLSPTGEYCVAARFRAGQNGGVVCYETRSGRKIWHRSDLRRVQGVKFSAANEAIWCEVEGQPVLSLDINTGLTLGSMRTICDVFDSPFTQHMLQEPRGRDRDLTIVGSKTLLVPRSTFAILDATFSPDALCLSEANGPVRCLNLETGKERWRYQPPAGNHVLRLSYQADQSFYGVQWAYEGGGPKLLLRFSQSTGSARSVCDLNTFPDALGFGPGEVLLSSGDVVSLFTGAIIRQLAFPMKDYPDSESEANAGE